MPKLSDDYSFACIYKIVYNEEIWYVGSTRVYEKRKCDHKSQYKLGKEMFFYEKMREKELNWEDMTMSLLEIYPILEGTPEEKKRKLERRERDLIEEIKPLYNTNKPAPNEEEKRARAAASARKRRAERPEIKEKEVEYARKYREKKKDDPEYREKKREQDKKYHDEKGKTRRRDRVTCQECFKQLSRARINNHACEPDRVLCSCIHCHKTMTPKYFKYQHNCSGNKSVLT